MRSVSSTGWPCRGSFGSVRAISRVSMAARSMRIAETLVASCSFMACCRSLRSCSFRPMLDPPTSGRDVVRRVPPEILTELGQVERLRDERDSPNLVQDIPRDGVGAHDDDTHSL